MDRRKRLLWAGLLTLLLASSLTAQAGGAGGGGFDGQRDRGFFPRGGAETPVPAPTPAPAPPPAPVPQAAPQDSLGEPVPPVRNTARLPLAIEVKTSTRNPAVRDTWILTLLIDHPNPLEVTIKSPVFPSPLLLDKVRTEPRVIEKEVEEVVPSTVFDPFRGSLDDTAFTTVRKVERHVWTLAEFSFAVRESGEAVIPPFEVAAPGKRGLTREIALWISPRSSPGRQRPVFRWEGPFPPMAPGEEGVVVLRLWNGEAPEGFLQGKAPENAVFEELPRSADDRGLYRFTLIPLAGDKVTLGPWELTLEGQSVTVPRLTVPLKAMPGGGDAAAPLSAPPSEDAPPAGPWGEASPEASPAHGFWTRFGPGAWGLFRGAYDKAAGEARRLWDEGKRAEALALLRSRERQSLAGRAFAPLREELEKEAGITWGEAEAWKPWLAVPPWAPALGMLAVASLVMGTFLRARRKGVTLRSYWGFNFTVVFFVFLGAALFLGAEGLSVRNRCGVMKEAGACKVPGGDVQTRFAEGQQVSIQGWPGQWVYVEAPDGRAGWVKSEAVALY